MDNGEKGILLALVIAIGSAYGWGWSVKPQVTYQIQYPSVAGIPSPYYVTAGYVANGSYLLNTNPLGVFVSVDNEGATQITFNITVSATNASISNNVKGPYEPSATEWLLAHAKNSFSTTFYVIPYANTPSFKLSLSAPQTVYGPDRFANIVYFVYSASIYSPVNLQSLTYVREKTSSNAYDPQT
jgi:hypothetical protein